jgi:hypothetical protein
MQFCQIYRQANKIEIDEWKKMCISIALLLFSFVPVILSKNLVVKDEAESVSFSCKSSSLIIWKWKRAEQNHFKNLAIGTTTHGGFSDER